MKYRLVGSEMCIRDRIIKIDKEFFRPAEVDLLIGNPGKAKRKLKWKPNTSLKKLVELMVDYDVSQIKNTH